MINAALVLEGGSLRTMYTSGVLDVFIENGIEFSTVIGVSAGALNAVNYVAKHIGRCAKINLLHSDDHNFFGIRQLLFKKSALNYNYLFKYMNELYPYDKEALASSKQRLFSVVINCETGNAEYLESDDFDEIERGIQASSSAPAVCRPVKIGEYHYLDGTIADPLRYKKAFDLGYDKIVVVRTRNIDYVEPPQGRTEKSVVKRYCKKYPKFLETYYIRPDVYNKQAGELRELAARGKVFVIDPKIDTELRAFERDARKLLRLYFAGREDARRLLSQVMEYLG